MLPVHKADRQVWFENRFEARMTDLMVEGKRSKQRRLVRILLRELVDRCLLPKNEIHIDGC